MTTTRPLLGVSVVEVVGSGGFDVVAGIRCAGVFRSTRWASSDGIFSSGSRSGSSGALSGSVVDELVVDATVDVVVGAVVDVGADAPPADAPEADMTVTPTSTTIEPTSRVTPRPARVSTAARTSLLARLPIVL